MPYFTRSGYSIFYRQSGTGKPLFILPGNTASSALHGGEMDYFSAHFSTTVLDFHGVGQSSRMAQFPLTWWEDNAHDTAALIQHLGGAPAVVIGTSGGALTALLLAALYPQLVRAVVADSFVDQHLPGVLAREVRNRAQRTPPQVAFWSAAHGADWEQVVDADSDLLLRVDAAGKNFIENCPEQITCPVLLTGSLTDSLLPNLAERMPRIASRISGSHLHLNNNGDHPWMWACLEDFRAVCDLFLSRLE